MCSGCTLLPTIIRSEELNMIQDIFAGIVSNMVGGISLAIALGLLNRAYKWYRAKRHPIEYGGVMWL